MPRRLRPLTPIFEVDVSRGALDPVGPPTPPTPPSPPIVGIYAARGTSGPSQLVSGRAPIAGDVGVIFWNGTLFSATVPTAPTDFPLVDSHRTGSNNPAALYVGVFTSSTIPAWGSSAGGHRWLMAILEGSGAYESPQATGASSTSTSVVPAGLTSTDPAGRMIQFWTGNSGSNLPSITGPDWTQDAVLSFNAGGGNFMPVVVVSYIGSGASPALTIHTAGAALYMSTGGVVVLP